MPLTINTRSYTIDDASQKNAVTYLDPNSTAAYPSKFKLARTDAKPTATFAGVTKGEAKVFKSVPVGGVPVSALIRAEPSIPVGAIAADVDLLIADFRSFVASTAFVDWVKGGKIYYG